MTKVNNYAPHKSRISSEALADFIRAPITGDLSEVPGIGDSAILALSEVEVDTTFALMGKYLMLKQKDVEPIEHAERFYLWLKSIGINSHRCAIVTSISEKMNITFVGIYDPDSYEEEE